MPRGHGPRAPTIEDKVLCAGRGNLVAGIKFAALSKLLLSPLRVLSWVQQTRRSLNDTNQLTILQSEDEDAEPNFFLAVKNKLQNDGPKFLYRGVIPDLLSYPIKKILKKKINCFTVNLLNDKNINNKYITLLVPSYATLIVLYPIHAFLVRRTLQKDFPNKDVNPLTLYNGLITAALGLTIYKTTYHKLYCYLSCQFTDGNHDEGLARNQKQVLRFISMVTAGVITYPFDTIVKRQMLNNAENMFEAFKNQVDKYGFYSLWEGFEITVVRSLMILGMLKLYGCRKG